MKLSLKQENEMLGSFGWQVPQDMEAGDRILGYTSRSVLHSGATLQVHAASSTFGGEDCKIRVFRLGWYGGTGARQVAMSEVIHVGFQNFWNKQSKKTSESVKEGCDWPVVYTIKIPEDWYSGLYVIRLELDDNCAYLHPFWLTTPNPSGLVLLFPTISWQARNWWGGASATHVHNGRPQKIRQLYYPIGSTALSPLRPMFNPRGGDALRWDYPFIRFIERNGIDIDYISDLDVENGIIDHSEIKKIITTGPSRYWTKKMPEWFENRVSSGVDYIHLGSEAGQHLVNVEHDGLKLNITPVKSKNSDFGERLENPLTNARVSGSKPRAPWGGLTLNNGIKIEGIMGTSWDKSIVEENIKILGTGKARHRFLSKRKVQCQLIERNNAGVVFNSGCSNWTWALSDFGRQGNIKVDSECQKMTWEVLGLELDELNLLDDVEEDTESQFDISKLTLDELNEVIRKSPKNHQAILSAAVILFESNKFLDALTYCERVLKLKPDWSYAKYYFGRCLYKLKRFTEMLPIYEELLKSSPDKYHYIVQYGQLLIELEQFNEGYEVLEGALRLRGGDSTPLVIMALGLRKQGKYKEAEMLLINALNKSPNNLQILIRYATLAQDQLDFNLAEIRWRRILRIGPDNYSALMGIVRCNLKLDKFEDVEQSLREIVNSTKYEHKISPYIELINVLTNYRKNSDEVISFCLKAIDKAGGELAENTNLSHVPFVHLALSLSIIGKGMEAAKLMEEQLANDPGNIEYILALSQIYRVNGFPKKSFKLFTDIFTSVSPQRTEVISNSVDHSYAVGALDSNIKVVKVDGPLVSVIMTAYKAEGLLSVAVDSILKQTWNNIELIIVDDCSPDNTFTILQNLSNADDRIKIIRMKSNGGTYIAKNEGLSKAKGKYVTFHDSDDWLHPSKIEMQVNLLEQNNNLVACSTKYLRVDENSTVIFHSKGATRHACISLMIRKDMVLPKIGYFDAVRVSADAEYEQRIKAIFGTESTEEIPIPLLIANVSSESLSQGGKFALEWNGITGSRLKYRSLFENWHQTLSQENNEQYVDHPLQKRAFLAPEEMIW